MFGLLKRSVSDRARKAMGLPRWAMHIITIAAVAGGAPVGAQEAGQPPKLRVEVVTGGHDFEREAFFAMFDSFEGIQYREVQHPAANDTYAAEAAKAYDVLVLYDLNEQISDEQKAALIALLRRGKGLVVLHHALADYQAWDEWERVVGGRYYLAPTTKDGKELPASTYHHGVDIPVHIADPKHPVTRGLRGFTIRDEVYGGFSVSPKVHVLLTTDHPESGKVIGWATKYGRSRIVYIQLGHDSQAYGNPNYRRFVEQAIRWVAKGK